MFGCLSVVTVASSPRAPCELRGVQTFVFTFPSVGGGCATPHAWTASAFERVLSTTSLAVVASTLSTLSEESNIPSQQRVRAGQAHELTVASLMDGIFGSIVTGTRGKDSTLSPQDGSTCGWTSIVRPAARLPRSCLALRECGWVGFA